MNRVATASALLVIGLIWGSTIPLSKIVVSSGHQPLGLIFWQLLFSSVLLGAISIRRRPAPKLNRRTLVFFLAVALLGTILPNSFSYLAISQLPAGVMAIIIASVPMFSLAIAGILRIERFSLIRSAGVLLGAVAVSLLILPETSLPDPDKAVFILVALVAPFCYGAEGNYIAVRAPRGMDAVSMLLGASVLGTLIAAPLALATGTWVDLFTSWHAPEWALLVNSLFHVAAYSGYIWLVSTAGPVFSSQVSYVVTLAGVLLSGLALGESYSGWVWMALSLMIAGLAMVRPRQVERAAAAG
jgi:drug/metabolite transporter (DMT)-like permease